MIKSFKVRIYPTKFQEALMWKHIGSCRFIWNYMLSEQEKLYDLGERYLSAFDMINLLKPLKNDGEHEWLYEVSNKSPCHTCQDLDKAYKSFFKKQSGFPKFKSRKRSKPNFPIRDTIYFKDGKAIIEKLGKVKYKTDFDFPQGRDAKFSNPRISFVNGKWILAFGMECENQTPELTEKKVGIDLGVKDLAVIAIDNESAVFHNINKSQSVRKLKRKIIYLQRSISRKYEQNRIDNKYVKTNNILRQEIKLRRLHTRLSNIRNNYIHQCTHYIVSKLPCRVVMEDLNVSGMMKNKHLSKAIQEQCFFEFIRQMKYKCEWNGIEFIQVSRFYPSSKTCSNCGCIKHDLKLSDRTYSCSECGFVIDRDLNAAINLMQYSA